MLGRVCGGVEQAGKVESVEIVWLVVTCGDGRSRR